MRHLTKKSLAVAATAVLLTGGGGVAFAYWTNSGSGTGAATTATNSGITINGAAITGLFPGQSAQTLGGTFTNSNAGSTYVTAVTASGYAIDATHVSAGCTVGQGNYSLGGSAPVGANVPAGSNVGSWTGLTITMNDLGSNQDVCKGATVTITYASS